MDDQTRITILFKEYDTLRSEISVRITSAFNLWNIAAAVIVIWATLQAKSLGSWLVLIVAAGILVAVWVLNELAVRKCARRIAQIERQINSLAGEELLQWESRLGAVATGYLPGHSKR